MLRSDGGMANLKRFLPILALVSITGLVFMFLDLNVSETLRSLPLERIGLGDHKTPAPAAVQPVDDSVVTPETPIGKGDNEPSKGKGNDGSEGYKGTNGGLDNMRPGKTKAVGERYTKNLVIPRTKEEDIEWINENFGGDEYIKPVIYVADDPTAPNHPPKNKGHEVMIYLTYIIDHYDDLADVNIFMHSHRFAWHNDEILGQDAVQMISRLSAERVQREGYMNMRCHWSPGCPDWMHPGNVVEDIQKQEETMLALSWSELFPLDPIPQVLAQPCCAQFAISRDRIRSIPLARFVFYRDWLLRTPLSDYISGRVWEYVWQFVFTAQTVFCPKEHICYCDGFGVCFGNEDKYNQWWDQMWEKRSLEAELADWKEKDDAIKEATENGKPDEAAILEVPEFGRNVELEEKIAVLDEWLEKEKNAAMSRGDVAKNRALECGREWHDGDGF